MLRPHRIRTGCGKFFVHTGNTTYGVQNLRYDPCTRNWIMAVYKGRREGFPNCSFFTNYSFFTVDGSAEPVRGTRRTRGV